MSDKIYASEIPTLLAEWNWDKNNDIGLHPNELLLGSNKKAWWKCEKGHEWLASIYHWAVRIMVVHIVAVDLRFLAKQIWLH